VTASVMQMCLSVTVYVRCLSSYCVKVTPDWWSS